MKRFTCLLTAAIILSVSACKKVTIGPANLLIGKLWLAIFHRAGPQSG
jgi:hypothetical protein